MSRTIPIESRHTKATYPGLYESYLHLSNGQCFSSFMPCFAAAAIEDVMIVI